MVEDLEMVGWEAWLRYQGHPHLAAKVADAMKNAICRALYGVGSSHSGDIPDRQARALAHWDTSPAPTSLETMVLHRDWIRQIWQASTPRMQALWRMQLDEGKECNLSPARYNALGMDTQTVCKDRVRLRRLARAIRH